MNLQTICKNSLQYDITAKQDMDST